jgi:hypothetical protein
MSTKQSVKIDKSATNTGDGNLQYGSKGIQIGPSNGKLGGVTKLVFLVFALVIVYVIWKNDPAFLEDYVPKIWSLLD